MGLREVKGYADNGGIKFFIKKNIKKIFIFYNNNNIFSLFDHFMIYFNTYYRVVTIIYKNHMNNIFFTHFNTMIFDFIYLIVN